ncbi:MAG: LytTR family transcriptional regulator DNA-binding domain-containing protein [Prevotellaceae bacterium]|jgi:cytochrome c oxidase subunit IV|nr:LytTR family transcriptional regulator DNA-binding domain-containing protein [Prevotellaceae bacterium]
MAAVRNKQYRIIYFTVWMVFAILQTLSIYSVSDFRIELLVIDTLVRSILFIPTGMLIYQVMRYAKYEKLPLVHQIINYSVLVMISISLWLCFGYIFDYLFTGSEFVKKLINILPFYILTGFMVYLILILFLRNKIILSKAAESAEENTNKQKNLTENESNDTQSSTDVEKLEHIAVKSGQNIHVIIVSDILYLQAFGDYVHIFTDSGKYLKEQTMKYFETNLPQQFVRIHRSYIVNIKAISRIELYEKQSQLLTLKNGHQIKISSTGYKLLKQKLNL